jgi:transposase
MSGGSSRRYPPELRERAVRMVAEISDQHDSEWAAISEVARLLGVGCAETVRKWVRQAQVDAGARPGTTTEESAELKTPAAGERRIAKGQRYLGRGRLFGGVSWVFALWTVSVTWVPAMRLARSCPCRSAIWFRS